MGVVRPLLVALVLALAACGSEAPSSDGGPAELTKDEYLLEGNIVCTYGGNRAQDRFNELLDLADADQADPATVQQFVTSFDAMLDELESLFRELRGLDGPDELEGYVRRVVDDGIEAVVELRDRMDEPAGGDAISEAGKVLQEVTGDLKREGLDACADL